MDAVATDAEPFLSSRAREVWVHYGDGLAKQPAGDPASSRSLGVSATTRTLGHREQDRRQDPTLEGASPDIEP